MTSLLIAWIARNGDPHGGDAEFRLCLLRTLKTASHETGHMFSMQHCTLYECNMCGSNHREEADRRPLWLCLHCLAKLCHATGADPIQRFKDLAAFSKRAGLKTEQEFYEKSLALLDDANCAVARHRQVSSWRRHAAVHADVIKPRLTRGWTPQPAVSHFTLGSLRQGPVQIVNEQLPLPTNTREEECRDTDFAKPGLRLRHKTFRGNHLRDSEFLSRAASPDYS